uniref:Uncharacterized protein n=1 Tax=Chromera velia CCMP2878 TaxID=1169474 RepID=A0A0G4FC18_9ALVE|eukprot:Cvel_16292.t1-p1 / transcript=Cvel_16292.t1 / gene=Cvel_16292 / organism=Chromera_velia_CCMP2878 / gene_product=hypothetical protein / transcript_product=hypothetical protein / location=Cvel_scaffold1249:4923-11983(-) / protein_length=1487 / sequence_SO=supercontig / SO=protein_coding / is_pseudo=false
MNTVKDFARKLELSLGRVEEGRLDEALVLAEEAGELDKTSFSVSFLKAQLLLQQGRVKRCLFALKRCLELDPLNEQALKLKNRLLEDDSDQEQPDKTTAVGTQAPTELLSSEADSSRQATQEGEEPNPKPQNNTNRATELKEEKDLSPPASQPALVTTQPETTQNANSIGVNAEELARCTADPPGLDPDFCTSTPWLMKENLVGWCNLAMKSLRFREVGYMKHAKSGLINLLECLPPLTSILQWRRKLEMESDVPPETDCELFALSLVPFFVRLRALRGLADIAQHDRQWLVAIKYCRESVRLSQLMKQMLKQTAGHSPSPPPHTAAEAATRTEKEKERKAGGKRRGPKGKVSKEKDKATEASSSVNSPPHFPVWCSDVRNLVCLLSVCIGVTESGCVREEDGMIFDKWGELGERDNPKVDQISGDEAKWYNLFSLHEIVSSFLQRLKEACVNSELRSSKLFTPLEGVLPPDLLPVGLGSKELKDFMGSLYGRLGVSLSMAAAVFQSEDSMGAARAATSEASSFQATEPFAFLASAGLLGVFNGGRTRPRIEGIDEAAGRREREVIAATMMGKVVMMFHKMQEITPTVAWWVTHKLSPGALADALLPPLARDTAVKGKGRLSRAALPFPLDFLATSCQEETSSAPGWVVWEDRDTETGTGREEQKESDKERGLNHQAEVVAFVGLHCRALGRAGIEESLCLYSKAVEVAEGDGSLALNLCHTLELLQREKKGSLVGLAACLRHLEWASRRDPFVSAFVRALRCGSRGETESGTDSAGVASSSLVIDPSNFGGLSVEETRAERELQEERSAAQDGDEDMGEDGKVKEQKKRKAGSDRWTDTLAICCTVIKLLFLIQPYRAIGAFDSARCFDNKKKGACVDKESKEAGDKATETDASTGACAEASPPDGTQKQTESAPTQKDGSFWWKGLLAACGMPGPNPSAGAPGPSSSSEVRKSEQGSWADDVLCRLVFCLNGLDSPSVSEEARGSLFESFQWACGEEGAAQHRSLLNRLTRLTEPSLALVPLGSKIRNEIAFFKTVAQLLEVQEEEERKKGCEENKAETETEKGEDEAAKNEGHVQSPSSDVGVILLIGDSHTISPAWGTLEVPSRPPSTSASPLPPPSDDPFPSDGEGGGSSVSVSPSAKRGRTYVSVPRLVTGLKIWHLSEAGSMFTKHGWDDGWEAAKSWVGERGGEGDGKCWRQHSDCPSLAALVSIGEIDCREGVHSAVLKGKPGCDSVFQALSGLCNLLNDRLTELSGALPSLPILVHPVPPVLPHSRIFVSAFNAILQGMTFGMRPSRGRDENRKHLAARALLTWAGTTGPVLLPLPPMTEDASESSSGQQQQPSERREGERDTRDGGEGGDAGVRLSGEGDLLPSLEFDGTHLHPSYVSSHLLKGVAAVLLKEPYSFSAAVRVADEESEEEGECEEGEGGEEKKSTAENAEAPGVSADGEGEDGASPAAAAMQQVSALSLSIPELAFMLDQLTRQSQ